MRPSYLILLAVYFFLSSQNPAHADGPLEILARLERLQRHEDVCILVNRSGAYRLERRYAAKHEVFAGALSGPQLDQFQQILNREELRNISRNDLPRPIIVDTIDQLLIDVYRSDSEQHLNFASPDARKKFRAGIDPVLKWLDTIQKSEHTQLDESSASHCMPPQFTAETSIERVTPRSVPYVMVFDSDRFRAGTVERQCVIVYQDGRYRREKSMQEYQAKIRLNVFSGSLTGTQLAELRGLLDVAELKNMKHMTYQKRPAEEANYTSLMVPRESSVQQLRFAHYFHVLADQDKPGGFAGLQYGVDPEEKVLDPLRDWLKKNVESQKVTPSPDTNPTNCFPDQL